MSEYYVMRHSGRRDGKWREVPTQNPRAKFAKLKESLRQGAVRLIRTSDRRVIDECSAPTLRTRW